MRRATSPTTTRVLGLGVWLGLLALLTPSLAAADEAPPLRRIEVVEVTWPGAPRLTTTAESVAKVIRDDTIERWRSLSHGRVVFTFDAILPTVTTKAALRCDAAGSVDFLNDVTLEAYSAAGFSEYDHRYLIVLAPDPGGCIWDGRGVLNPPGSTSGMLVLKNTDNGNVIAHELGHNLGLGHSNFESCSDSRADGDWADCSAIEYGSATDLMGNLEVTSPLAAYHQWRLGLIPDADVTVADRSMAVALRPVDSDTGTRAVFLRDGSAAYWLEYRRDDPANGIRAGLVVYRSDPPPAASVVSPFGPSTAKPGEGVTTDVWMISLGDYRYPTPATGSPSLRAGVRFTTAYGAVSFVARANNDDGVLVDVTRKPGRPPAAPVWTNRSTWNGPLAPITSTNLDNGGTAIAHFQARITGDSGTSLSTVPASPQPLAQRTYLAPVGAPVAVVAGSLPEGRYGLALRAVTVAGVAGAWSASRSVAVDHGAPAVDARFAVDGVQPARAMTVRWSGARDPGVGICSARAFDDDGFALVQWRSAKAGTPSFSVSATESATYRAVVQDCFGNQTWGSLELSARWRSADAYSRSGSWGAAATSRCTVGTCTATIRTGPGATALIVGKGSGTIRVDGRRTVAIADSNSSTPRVALRVGGAHVITLRTTNLEWFGAQSLHAQWQAAQGPAPVTLPTDVSLVDDRQAALSRFGFSQTDFATATVLPMTDGTTTKQATLDLCNATFPSEAERQLRRQVVATSGAGDPNLFLSTETVKYTSVRAVRRAIAELDAAAALCRSQGYSVSAAGVHDPYVFHPLPELPANLRPAADRRIYSFTTGTGSGARSLLIAYQFKGVMLNALYLVRKGENSIDAATTSRWLAMAAVLAQRLERPAPAR